MLGVPDRSGRILLRAERGSCRHERITFLFILSSFLLLVFEMFGSRGAVCVSDERMSVSYMLILILFSKLCMCSVEIV